jgi:predicted  nucleic acid-binding Zn-ribbon protein
MKPSILAWIVVAMGILTTTTAAHAPLLQLDSCHDDLDSLRRRASDASDAAENAESMRNDFEDCETNSELHEGCSSQRSDYESALSDLESKMDDVDSRLRSVQTSCGYEFTINRLSAAEASQHQLEASHRRLEASKHRLCTSIKNLLRLGMTPATALQMCKANSDEQWCKACLGLK